VISLSVNIDHVATVRQARRGVEPDPVWAATEAQLGGADGITVHLREDRRHINDDDLRRLKDTIQVPLNLEMAPVQEMADIAVRIQPRLAMLVPEGRQEITTEGGLDVQGQQASLKRIFDTLHDAGITTSVFIEADERQIAAAARLGASVCEIHTGNYARVFSASSNNPDDQRVLEECARIQRAGRMIQEAGMIFNAGHALNYWNVPGIARISGVRELHIGHAIISRSLFVGVRAAVREMKDLIQGYVGSGM